MNRRQFLALSGIAVAGAALSIGGFVGTARADSLVGP